MPIEIKDPKRLPKDFCIFFCWQDHLEKKLHRFLIRDALNAAIAHVQSELPDSACVIRLDSDTMDRSGSVNIADTILEKIATATVVVGDVTPVSIESPHDRCYYPNPNVMVEIGFASRCVGWSQVVLVLNSAACDPVDLPFDVRGRRISVYRCANEADRKSAHGQLKIIFQDAIIAVVQRLGRGEVDSIIGTASLRRQRDIRLLREFMETIDCEWTDWFIDRARQAFIDEQVIYRVPDFTELVTASRFHFHDAELERLISEFADHWHELNNLASCLYSSDPQSGRLIRKSADHMGEADNNMMLEMLRRAAFMSQVFPELLRYIHHHYPEIDELETSRNARERVRPWLGKDCT